MTRICSKTGQRTIIMDKGDRIRLQLKLPKCVPLHSSVWF